MAEYIEREALYEKLEARYKYSNGAAHKAYGLAIDDVCDAPAADVTVQRWIPVTDRLPEKDIYVWCYSNRYGGYFFVGYRGYISGDFMEGGSLHIGDVTHWMPLPEPPQEVDE